MNQYLPQRQTLSPAGGAGQAEPGQGPVWQAGLGERPPGPRAAPIDPTPHCQPGASAALSGQQHSGTLLSGPIRLVGTWSCQKNLPVSRPFCCLWKPSRGSKEGVGEGLPLTAFCFGLKLSGKISKWFYPPVNSVLQAIPRRPCPPDKQATYTSSHTLFTHLCRREHRECLYFY